jgi:hypothetical protein
MLPMGIKFGPSFLAGTVTEGVSFEVFTAVIVYIVTYSWLA